MKRTVIKIDESLCNGCGNCIDGCHEGALQLIDGKAVMISDLYCDGLGACMGECPLGAISFEEREAEPYDEAAVIGRLVSKGESVILAHLKHLKEHEEHEWLHQGIDCLKSHGIEFDPSCLGMGDHAPGSGQPVPCDPEGSQGESSLACGCPGSMTRELIPLQPAFASGFGVSSGAVAQAARPLSELRQFPVQLHLLDPRAGFLHGADLLLAADCTAFASGEFHSRFLKGKILAVACPKLDSNTQDYVDKLAEMIDRARIGTLTVLVMEVPCCSGLVRIARLAREQTERNVPLKIAVLSVNGEVLSEEWV